MSLESVVAFLAQHAPDIAVVEVETSTATVALAAAAHGLETGQIAKTLALHRKDDVILLVLNGDARIDNQKYKARFGVKAKMLDAEEVVAWTSHPVGGVCPFGLPHPLKVFADVSLRKYDVVLPAAGSIHAALEITPDRLAHLADAEWVDVARIG
jgi:prolyl-tRNA editing enzyme YbaK/EbsC (Cys-tRNA(Pro) deacylase)